MGEGLLSLDKPSLNLNSKNKVVRIVCSHMHHSKKEDTENKR